jgi:hypothetical protein
MLTQVKLWMLWSLDTYALCLLERSEQLRRPTPPSSHADLKKTNRPIVALNSRIRLVTNDIILLHLLHDRRTRLLQGCSKGPKGPKRLYRRTLCASKHILLSRVMPLLKAYRCPYPPYPFPLLPLIRALALTTYTVP